MIGCGEFSNLPQPFSASPPGSIHMRHLLGVALIIGALVLAALAIAPTAGAKIWYSTENDLPAGNFYQYEVEMGQADDVYYRVRSNASIDVYWMDTQMLKDYKEGGEFSSIHSYLNITELEETIRVEFPGIFLLVVDNVDDQWGGAAVGHNVSVDVRLVSGASVPGNSFCGSIIMAPLLALVGVGMVVRRRQA